MKNKHWAEPLIEKAGLKKIDVARACGCSYNHFANIMGGTFNASPKLEEKISEVVAMFDPQERAKQSFVLPIAITKTILPAFRRIPVDRIGIDPSIVREPAPETREQILEQAERARRYTEDIECNRPLPPIAAIQVDGLNFYLLLGRAVLQAAQNSLRTARIEAYVYNLTGDDVPYLKESEIFIPALSGVTLESEKEN